MGDLIERLGEFDPTAPIRVQLATSRVPDFIVSVGESPDVAGVVAIVYMAPPESAI
ncbi:MAG: hypothetical protein ACRDPY_30370 [Streptosporangiaceae bacterium]